MNRTYRLWELPFAGLHRRPWRQWQWERLVCWFGMPVCLALLVASCTRPVL